MTLFDQDPILDTTTTPCKGCQAQIRWVRTQANDKPAPVDAKPVKVYVGTSSTRDNTPVAKLVDGFVPHFATCPDAASFRGPR